MRRQPFQKVHNKVENAQMALRRLAQAGSDKSNGIESTEANLVQWLVELLRMCSVDELVMLVFY